MSQIKEGDYIQLSEISPSKYVFTIQHTLETKTPAILVHQFKSMSAAESAAHHYNTLLGKAYALGYTLEGYFLYGPSGQVLPISDVFDLDMSIRYVEQHLSSALKIMNSNQDSEPFSPIQSMF